MIIRALISQKSDMNRVVYLFLSSYFGVVLRKLSPSTF